MTHTQILSTRIANLESLVAALPELRTNASQLQAELTSLRARVTEVDSLIQEGERAERTLNHLAELADRVLAAGVAMSEEAPAPAPDAAPEETSDERPADDSADTDEDAGDVPEVQTVAPEAPVPDDEPEDDEPAEAPVLPDPTPDETEDEDEPLDDSPLAPALNQDNLLAYLAAHPGAVPADIAEHFGATKRDLGLTLSAVRRQKKAECLLSNPPRWFLTADLPEDRGEVEAQAPATPLPELPPEPPQSVPEIPDVPDADLDLLVAFLHLRGNQTHRQVHAEFRYSHSWTPAHVEQLVAAGMARGVLSAVGGSGTRARIGVVRRSSGLAS